MDKGKTPINIYVNLSKAFDTLNHEILLHKLHHYGIKRKANELICSYLSNRKQDVKYKNENSEMQNITTGVPQGSIIGPLLFIIYIYDISNSTNSFHSVIYADESTLCGTLNTFGQYSSDNINLELQKVSDWLAVNELSLNIKKTQYMIMRTKNKYIIKPSIIFNGEEI